MEGKKLLKSSLGHFNHNPFDGHAPYTAMGVGGLNVRRAWFLCVNKQMLGQELPTRVSMMWGARHMRECSSSSSNFARPPLNIFLTDSLPPSPHEFPHPTPSLYFFSTFKFVISYSILVC